MPDFEHGNFAYSVLQQGKLVPFRQGKLVQPYTARANKTC